MKAGDVQGFLYRCYDICGELIYVGSTADIGNRIQVHWNQSEFADRIDVVRYSAQFTNIRDARGAEKAAIRAECPLLNQIHNPDYECIPRVERRARFLAVLADILPTDRDFPDVEDDRGLQAVLDDQRRALDLVERTLWGPGRQSAGAA